MKLNDTIMITIAALVILLMTGIAKADVNEVGTKVSNFIQNEISKTKEYQTKSWAKTKKRWPWNVLLKEKNDTQN